MEKVKTFLKSVKLPKLPHSKTISAVSAGILLGLAALAFKGDLASAFGTSVEKPPSHTTDMPVPSPEKGTPNTDISPLEVEEVKVVAIKPSPETLGEANTPPDPWVDFECPPDTKPLFDPKAGHVGCILIK